jgi:plastocyanin
MIKIGMSYVIGLLAVGVLSSCNSTADVPFENVVGSTGKDIKVTCTPTSIVVGAKSICKAELQENSVMLENSVQAKPIPVAFKFISSDPKNATVKNNVVTGLAVGETTITATDGTTTSKIGVKITVVDEVTALPLCPTSITISGLKYLPSNCKIKLGTSITIPANSSYPISGSGAGITIPAQTKKTQVLVFKETGKFEYQSDIYAGQGMKGSITVIQ